jgi:hypothetical protein
MDCRYSADVFAAASLTAGIAAATDLTGCCFWLLLVVGQLHCKAGLFSVLDLAFYLTV